MTYTPSVPQGNQTIASSTDPIRNNFTFIQTDMRVEHSFNGNVGGLAEGVHLKASMPNAATPAVPAGCNGVYYVKNGQAWFNNGSLDVQLSLNTSMPGFTPFLGSIVVAAGPFPKIVNLTPTISGDKCGEITLIRESSSSGAYYSFYRKTPSSGVVFPVKTDFTNTSIFWNSGTLALSAGGVGTYIYYGWFYPTA